MLRKVVVACLFITFILSNTVVLVHAEGPNTVDKWLNDDQKSNDTIDNKSDEPKVTEQDAPVVEGGSTFLSLVKLVFALIFVLALIYGLYRFVSKRTKTYQNYGAIRNIGGVAVGSNRSVQLVRVGKEILVVGVGESVQLLKEINDPELIENILDQNESPDQIGKTMDKVVTRVKGYMTNRQQKASTTSADSDFKQLLTQKLKKMGHERKENFQSIKREESDQ